MSFPIQMLHVYKESWDSGSTYIKGDWVKGSDSKLYLALLDGGEAEDPIADTNNDYWIIKDNYEYNFANAVNDPVSYNGLNLLIDRFNMLLQEMVKNGI
jgi:hypothetical protein